MRGARGTMEVMDPRYESLSLPFGCRLVVAVRTRPLGLAATLWTGGDAPALRHDRTATRHVA